MPSKISLRVSSDDDEVAYLVLPDHPGIGTPGIVHKMIRLHDLLRYEGADIHLDIDADGRLIGIEILC